MSALRGLYAGMLLLGLRRPCEDGLKPRRRTPRPYCVAAPERMRGSGGERLPRSRRPQRKRLRRRRSQILIEGEPATRLIAKRGVSVIRTKYRGCCVRRTPKNCSDSSDPGRYAWKNCPSGDRSSGSGRTHRISLSISRRITCILVPEDGKGSLRGAYSPGPKIRPLPYLSEIGLGLLTRTYLQQLRPKLLQIPPRESLQRLAVWKLPLVDLQSTMIDLQSTSRHSARVPPFQSSPV